MTEYTDDQLYAMSDEELEKVVTDLRVENNSTETEKDTQISEEDQTNQETTDESSNINEEAQESSEEQVLGSTNEATQEPVSEPQTYKIRANGKEYDLTLDELKQLAPKAMDYVKKTTTLKPFRSMVKVIQDNNITQEDLGLLVDLKQGNKEAIGKLIKDNNIDVYDLPEDVNYTPRRIEVSEKQMAFNDVINELQSEPEYDELNQIYTALDNPSKTFFYENPQALKFLHQDIVNGDFSRIFPLADKQAVLDGYSRPFIEYYIKVATSQSNQQQAQPQSTPQPVKTEQKPQNTSYAKKAASIPTNTTGSKTVINYLDEIDDEKFDEWYKSLQREI